MNHRLLIITLQVKGRELPQISMVRHPGKGPISPPMHACMLFTYEEQHNDILYEKSCFQKILSCLTGFIVIFDEFGTFWTSLQVAPQMYSYLS
jgi:hypothetical protein